MQQVHKEGDKRLTVNRSRIAPSLIYGRQPGKPFIFKWFERSFEIVYSTGIMNNEKMFDFLYKDNYNRMLTYCISRKIKQEDAEEIVDEAFGRLWKKFDQIND